MKHTYSHSENDFENEESIAALLCQNCTRTQAVILRRVIECCWVIRDHRTSYPNPFYVAVQLKDMRADVPTVVSALLGTDAAAREYSISWIHEQFGQEFAKLTQGVRWINELSMRDAAGVGSFGARDQAEMLRRMVLSMVEDIRVILVKLAYRTQRLYMLVKLESHYGVAIANETLSIYTPLANRLGLGQLKWELEDVAFRIVEPQAYKRIAKALEESRAAREDYINEFVQELTEHLKQYGVVDADVFGRPKHIYSIWKKMRAKRIEFNDLFDVRAVRVLVHDLQSCYGVLGIVHSSWQPITREFDDYIANPKENGYQSLHTAVIGPNGRAVEVQIRTREMDDSAENGVAAHWAYKEGDPVDENLLGHINTLRQLLDDSDDEQLVEGFSQHLDSRRVYVFTPQGEVIDLVAGATPLDFAYHVHSEIGHRCRGAKVNGRIVPLTYLMQNGDQVEVLTTREASPSRDWLNQSLGYLQSARARSKVRAWFNIQDHAQQISNGRTVLDRELKRLRAAAISVDKIASRLKYARVTDLYAALGRNDVTIAQVAGALDFLAEPAEKLPVVTRRASRQSKVTGAISVRGVGNLLTQMASCCQPVPDDSIVGFITRGKGVSVHRADCGNMLNLPEQQRERLIEVEWGEDSSSQYRVEIRIVAFDRQGLLRDISTVLSALKIDVVGVHTNSDAENQIADMRISLHIGSIEELASVMEKIRLLRNVQSVERVI